MTLRNVIRDPSLMRGAKIVQKENVVTVGDHVFECSTKEIANRVWSLLSQAKFAYGITARGQAKSRQHFDFGGGNSSATGWTNHN